MLKITKNDSIKCIRCDFTSSASVRHQWIAALFLFGCSIILHFCWCCWDSERSISCTELWVRFIFNTIADRCLLNDPSVGYQPAGMLECQTTTKSSKVKLPTGSLDPTASNNRLAHGTYPSHDFNTIDYRLQTVFFFLWNKWEKSSIWKQMHSDCSPSI